MIKFLLPWWQTLSFLIKKKMNYNLSDRASRNSHLDKDPDFEIK